MSNTSEFEPTKKTPIKRDGITPGPWEIGSEVDEMGRRSISGQGWVHFADVTTRMSGEIEDCADGIANANLIAAAPDLLEAIEKIVNKYNGLSDGDIQSRFNNGDFFEAEAAIKKAKGLQP